MNRKINSKISNEIWFSWLMSKLNSFEVFKEFALGKTPKDVAEMFISINKEGIRNAFKRIDEEDKETLNQFQKLAECESHVFRILNNQFDEVNKVKYIDFKKMKN